ncbi:hypothetical protein Gohar_013323, partial [Gossypium harknessii]|nr:hypothetical protein [Gossypium harknessii]
MKQFNGKEIDEWVVCYIRELERIEERNITRSRGNEEWNPPIDSLIKINFDASFNQTHAKVGSRVVARNASVEIVASKMVFYIEVASPFMAESHACLQVLLLGIQLRFRAMKTLLLVYRFSSNPLRSPSFFHFLGSLFNYRSFLSFPRFPLFRIRPDYRSKRAQFSTTIYFAISTPIFVRSVGNF